MKDRKFERKKFNHKGFEHLVEAAALVLRERDCAFVVAGEGELHEAISRRIAGLGIENRFHLLGFRPDIGEVLAALDVFAFPSVTEGLGTSLLDALLLELPVVASRTGGIPEVVEHGVNGLLVEPENARDLAAAILRLLADRDEARRLGAEGRRRVLKSFSVEAMVEGTLAAYHEAGSIGD